METLFSRRQFRSRTQHGVAIQHDNLDFWQSLQHTFGESVVAKANSRFSILLCLCHDSDAKHVVILVFPHRKLIFGVSLGFLKIPSLWCTFFVRKTKNCRRNQQKLDPGLHRPPSPKGWKKPALKNHHQMLQCCVLQNLGGTSIINTESWENPMEYTKFLKSSDGEICPRLASWIVERSESTKTACPMLKTSSAVVGLPQSYNNMPHHFAHKIMPFPWHLDHLEMTPPIDPTCLQPFNKVKLPSNLETLTFGEKFNQILELPPKLCLRCWWPISRPRFQWRNPCFEHAHDISRSSVLLNFREI